VSIRASQIDETRKSLHIAARRDRDCNPTRPASAPTFPSINLRHPSAEGAALGYTPDWSSLADALKHVVASGASSDAAKADISHAVADQKVRVRVRIAACYRDRGGQVYSGGNVSIPPHLDPGDLDWQRSMPLRPWSTGPMPGQHYYDFSWENRPIDFIELSTADVDSVVCGTSANPPAVDQPPADLPDDAFDFLPPEKPATNQRMRRQDSQKAPTKGKSGAKPAYDWEDIE
jgi:hypothetical protein